MVTVAATTPVPLVGPVSVANEGSDAVSALSPVAYATTFTVRVLPAFSERSDTAETVGAWASAVSGASRSKPRMRHRRADFMGPPWMYRGNERSSPRQERGIT